MNGLLERLAYATKRASPYWRWILAAVLFLLASLAAYGVWRKMERLRKLENERGILMEKLRHDRIKARLVSNAEERKALAGAIEVAEKRVAMTEIRIATEEKIAAALKASLSKAQTWKDLE